VSAAVTLRPVSPADRAPCTTRALQRAALALAAAYNVAFGVWAVTLPHSFFAVFALEPPRYPAIWQTLGMVIGLYGLLYAYAAWRPDRAKPIVAIGLAGKILGPIGWLVTVGSGELPARTFALIAFDDLVWWLPFALILVDGLAIAPRVRAAAPYACLAINALAAAILATVLAPGATFVASAASTAHIAANATAWRLGWLVWIAAAISLLAFFCWWAARLPRSAIVLAALALATVGVALDVTAESLLIGWAPDGYPGIVAPALRLSGVGANGLYSVAGALLAWRTRGLPRWLTAWTWAVWIAGGALADAAIVRSETASQVATAVLFALFLPWLAVFGRRLA
jgi:hypothetical protein